MIVALRVLVFLFFFTAIFVSSEPVSLTLSMHICNALWALPLQASSDAAISKCNGFILRELQPQCLELIFRKVFLDLFVSVCFCLALESQGDIFSRTQ